MGLDENGDRWQAIIDDWSSSSKTLCTNDPFVFSVAPTDWEEFSIGLELGALVVVTKTQGREFPFVIALNGGTAARCRIVG